MRAARPPIGHSGSLTSGQKDRLLAEFQHILTFNGRQSDEAYMAVKIKAFGFPRLFHCRLGSWIVQLICATLQRPLSMYPRRRHGTTRTERVLGYSIRGIRNEQLDLLRNRYQFKILRVRSRIANAFCNIKLHLLRSDVSKARCPLASQLPTRKKQL